MSMFVDFQHLPEHFIDNDKIDVNGAYIMPSKLHNCFFVVRNKSSIEVEKVVETGFKRKIEAEKFIERNKT